MVASFSNQHHTDLFGRSMEKYSVEKILENLREIVFRNCLVYIYLNDAYSDFLYRFVEAISFIAPAKRIRVKANSEPLFNNQIISAILRQDKLNHSGLKIDQNTFKAVKIHLQSIMLKKKKCYFEEEIARNRNKLKELWKANQTNRTPLLSKLVKLNSKH